ncbi:MAG: hypothetical protein COW89_06360 [Nitrospinae bacterium CG22_combo_CG10-13_8_21_14_all_47_10]|nr:MAG: hypothetical protein COW89_06360 [Nitrospinae bacterium CG22_combo_CG10-13_8_21_14_all_47_10]
MSDNPSAGELLPEGSPHPKISPQEIWELEKDKAIRRAIHKAIDRAVSGGKGHPKKPVVDEAVKKSLVEVKTLALEYSSPLPPPAQMRELEELQSGSTDRLLALVESGQAHEQYMDREFVAFQNENLKLNAEDKKRGVNSSLIITITGMALATVAAIAGKEDFAVKMVTITLGSIVGMFLVERFRISKKPPRQTQEGKK